MLTMFVHSCIYFFISFLCLTTCTKVGHALHDNEDKEYNKAFYDVCAQGTLEQVNKYLDEDSELATAATPDGETCLHLTAISKNLEVAKRLIDLGATVNRRVTHSKGLRMTPLSWHVYAGNYDIVKLLLDNGAEINMDFDLNVEDRKKVTVLDISSQLALKAGDDFKKTHQLLVSRGGKLFDELNSEL